MRSSLRPSRACWNGSSFNTPQPHGCVYIEHHYTRTEHRPIFYALQRAGKARYKYAECNRQAPVCFCFLGWFFGGFDGFLYALIIFVVTDYFTGILAAGIRKELSSEVGFKGIAKKVCIFLLVGVAKVIDTQVLQNGAAIRTAVIFFYLSNEGLSILENSAVIGIPIPEKLKDMLIQLTNEKHIPEKDDEKEG